MEQNIDDELEKLNNNTDDDKEIISDKERKTNNNFFSYFLSFIVTSLLIGIIILIITLLLDKNIFSRARNYYRSDQSILKPNSDFKKYRTLILKNGLEAILISDPLAVTAGASLSVRVGANSDPDTLLGLAHFCEHMLFLGSNKYPNGDDYFKTVTENNGHFNAYTDREITNYFFDIHYYTFEKALDIFSRFFIDPIFSEEKLNKEINSVNSEFEKNLIIDSRKRAQVLAYLIDKTSPFNRFTTGNIQTLTKNAEKLGMNLRNELIKFHKKFYIANKMKLVLYSNEEMDDLEDMVIDKFSEIKSDEDYINKNLSNDKLKNNNNQFLNKTETLDFNFNKKLNITKVINFENKSISALDDVSKFKNPFLEETLGSFIQFKALTLEHELTIIFVQKSLSDISNFYHNPYYYFEYILESKDDNSLIDILKKRELATKLSVTNERDYKNWSDFVISINLTPTGLKNLNELLGVIKGYLTYMKNNLINEKYYDYLKKVSILNFQFKISHSNLVSQQVSSIGARFQKYPLKYLLDENHLLNNFNNTVLDEYANGLNLEKSMIMIPSKENQIPEFNFLDNKTMNKIYEPWYRTDFIFYKINYTNINEIKINSSDIKLIDENHVSNLIKNHQNFTCDKKCFGELKTFSNTEPNLLNKTNLFELWHKNENTLDFKKTIVDILFKYDKFENENEKIHILLLETYLKRKIKKLNSKLKFFSNSISILNNIHGIKISFSSFTENIISITKELIDKLHIFSAKEKIKDFGLLVQEVHDHLLKEYNAQPYALAYEYLKKNVLNGYITSEEYLKILTNTTQDDFINFINVKFNKNYYVKLLVIGDIKEKKAREVFTEFNSLLKINQISTDKTFKWSIKQKRKNRRVILKHSTGNFLLKKEYHQATNKNNVLLKCYQVGKNNYKNEIMIKLFNGIIGNIVFRELRINKQFGYVAKSKIELFDNLIVSKII